MTGRELIKKLEIEDLGKGLFYLGQYTGNGEYYLNFPDANAPEVDEVEFMEYYEEQNW